ncbi:MAG: hypothetical protein U1A77_02100 [Pirellulales bacterium]
MSDAPSGFGQFARRWGQWASNLLVSGIVIVVAIALGREVLQWWYVDPTPLALGRPDSAGAPAALTLDDPLGLPGTSEELRFGELPFAFGHGVVEGKAEKAVDVLARECERAAALADASERKPGPAEQRLLALLQGEKPRSTAGNRWSTYVIVRPVPMAVAVSGSERLPAARRRVLAWGLLLPEQMETPAESDSTPAPSPTTRWGWFTWRPSRSDGISSEATQSWPQLPNGQRSLSIRTVDGGARIAYVGSGTPDRWREAFDRWFADQGWQGSPNVSADNDLTDSQEGNSAKASPWQKLGQSWNRRYTWSFEGRQAWPAGSKTSGMTPPTSKKQGPAGPQATMREAEVQVILERTGTLRAMLIVSPSAAGQ